MCDPLTITGIALSAGSTVMQTMAANKVQNARNDALLAERLRQRQFDDEAAALNAQSQDRYTGFEGKQDAEGQKLGDYFASQTAAEPSAAEALPASSSNLVVAEEGRNRAAARRDTNESGAALGNLRAFGDLLSSTGRLQARDAGTIGQIGSFKQGSSGVLPFELEDANSKGGGLRLLGDIMGGAGSVAMSAGLSGKSLLGGSGGAKASVRPRAKPMRLGGLYGGM